jgi:hypothetical protein
VFNKDGKQAMDAETGQPIFRSKEEETWNPSVANLSLMALGSSTPEILLNVIETCCSGFYSGDLGEHSMSIFRPRPFRILFLFFLHKNTFTTHHAPQTSQIPDTANHMPRDARVKMC